MKTRSRWYRVSAIALAIMAWWGPTPGESREPQDIRVERSSEGGRYSMEFREADIRDVLRAISQERGISLVIGEGVTGQVTLSFQDVTLANAMDAILKTGDWTKIEESGITRIVKSTEAGTGDLVTKMLPVQYASAKDLEGGIKTLLSKKGSMTVDGRTNTLIVRDMATNAEWITDLVKQLDSRTPQVMIEARIVEASTNFTRELGVQWGGAYTTQSGNRLTTFHGGAAKKLSTDTAAEALTGGIGLSGGPFAVNLPAAVQAGHGGAIGVSFGNVADTVRLDLQLSALEDSGKGRILSTPRVLTLDNKEARISAGTEILIPTSTIVTAGSTTGGGSVNTPTGVQTIDAKLELAVTPHVTPNGEIVMHVKADKKDPDYTRQVEGIPPLNSRTAETDLLVKNGETVVIGGIFTTSTSVAENGVPWLSKIPVLGWLFKKRSTVETQNELLVFITPTIH
ncbi:MAG TPA: type IV pilus secretin PilQ, partial [Nitrospiria bacterium]|nr:type IV pilus secretin PilQ [Nitrospiria bacterium]